LVQFGAGQPRFTPRQYESLADEGYRKNVVAYRAIRLVSQNAAAVPWIVRKGKGRQAHILEDHDLALLLRRPNPMQGGAELFDAFYAFYLIAGNAYMEAVEPEGLPPRELWTLRPDRMRIIPGAGGVPAAYRYSVNGRNMDF